MGLTERRTRATARFIKAAQWVADDHGLRIVAPAAVADVEAQRLGLLEYAADILDALRTLREAERGAPAQTEQGPSAPKGKAK